MNASQDSEYLKSFKGEYESPCACEAHRTCKRGGDTKNAFGGIILGAAKIGIPILKRLAEQYSTLSMDDFYDRFSMEERIMIQEAIEKTWQDIEQSAENWIVGSFDFDPTSKTSKNFQAGAYYGLSAIDFFRPNIKNPFASIKPSIVQTTGIGGWKVGDSIRNLTKKGNIPSWSTVRARHWKNRAQWAKHNPNDYEAANIARMEKGLAPQQVNPLTGTIDSMELHHNPAQREGGLFDFIEVWPEAHAEIDPHRFIRGK